MTVPALGSNVWNARHPQHIARECAFGGAAIVRGSWLCGDRSTSEKNSPKKDWLRRRQRLGRPAPAPVSRLEATPKTPMARRFAVAWPRQVSAWHGGGRRTRLFQTLLSRSKDGSNSGRKRCCGPFLGCLEVHENRFQRRDSTERRPSGVAAQVEECLYNQQACGLSGSDGDLQVFGLNFSVSNAGQICGRIAGTLDVPAMDCWLVFGPGDDEDI